MDTPRRRPATSIIEALFRDPSRFDFFQAIRILRWWLRGRPRRAGASNALPEVQLRAATGLGFPPAAVETLMLPEGTATWTPTRDPEMTVAFLGLVGPSGVLPQHYTALVLRRQRQKDETLRDFLDVFHHRLALLFHAAWEKHRLPVRWENATRDGETGDPYTGAMLALVGHGTPALQRRLPFADARLLYFAAHFARQPRSASALADMLAHWLGVPVAVEQFRAAWLRLDPGDRTRLTSAGQFCRLGAEAVLGERVRDMRHRFRVRVGPLDYAAFRRLLPPGRQSAELQAFVRHFAAPELSYDILLELTGSAVPACRLGGPAAAPDAPRLGWTAWLRDPASAASATDVVIEGRAGG